MRMYSAALSLPLPIRAGFPRITDLCVARTLICDSSPQLACSDKADDFDTSFLDRLSTAFLSVYECEDANDGHIRAARGRNCAQRGITRCYDILDNCDAVPISDWSLD